MPVHETQIYRAGMYSNTFVLDEPDSAFAVRQLMVKRKQLRRARTPVELNAAAPRVLLCASSASHYPRGAFGLHGVQRMVGFRTVRRLSIGELKLSTHCEDPKLAMAKLGSLNPDESAPHLRCGVLSPTLQSIFLERKR